MENKTTLNMRIQREDNLNTVVYDDTVGAGNGRHYYEVERNENHLQKFNSNTVRETSKAQRQAYLKPTFWKSCVIGFNAFKTANTARERTLAHLRILKKLLCGLISVWQTVKSVAYSAQ